MNKCRFYLCPPLVLKGNLIFFAFAASRNLSAEELEKKRQEMMANAKWREEERANAVKKHRKEEAREQERDKLGKHDGKFIQ